jgi:hypothetical protein
MMLRFAFIGVLLTTAVSLRANDRLAMKVSPAVAFAPANLVVQTYVEANQSNRSMEIIADSEGFYRSSQIQLNGDRAPRTTRFEFRSMPSGVYSVRAVLKGARGQELASTETHVNVVATGGSQR